MTLFLTRLSAHIGLSAAALGLALLISLPLVALMLARARSRGPVLGAASVIQTIPALALLALFYPLLLALRSASGLGVPALGFLPALLALTLYALLPILRGAVTGIAGVDADAVEAATALGMTRLQRLSQVELPLAAPVIMAGIRTAAVWTIGAATLATPVGATSLGDYIFSGLQTEDWAAVATGCAGSAGLALAVDGLLALVESGLGRSSRTRIAAGAAGLALIGALAVFGARGGSSEHRVVVGAKNFSEQYILADLIATRLRAAGMPVEIRSGLGSAVAFRALAAGDIDVYVDYAGTLATTMLKRADNPALPALAADLERRTGVGRRGAAGVRERLRAGNAARHRQAPRHPLDRRPRRASTAPDAGCRPRIPDPPGMARHRRRLRAEVRHGAQLRADVHVPRAVERQRGRHLRLLQRRADRGAAPRRAGGPSPRDPGL